MTVGISLTPGFSGVLAVAARPNRFSGLSTDVKPLRRLTDPLPVEHTPLKQGVNEIWDQGA